MTIAQNAILRVVATFSLGSASQAQNVYHVRHATASAQDDDDVLDAIEEWLEDLYTTISSLCTTAITMTKAEVYEWDGAEWGPVGVRTPTWAGTAAVDRVASGIAMLVNAFKLRSGHSDKKYLAGVAEVRMDDDEWDSTALASGNVFAAFWIAPFTATNAVDLVAEHWVRGLSVTKAYVSKSVNTLVAYQRRRKPGVGLT